MAVLQPTKMTFFLYFIKLETVWRTHKIWMYRLLFPRNLVDWSYTVEILWKRVSLKEYIVECHETCGICGLRLVEMD
jgi:hypothetical protein